jgi:hypothetical protein
MEETEVVFNHETRMGNTEARKRTTTRGEAEVMKERSRQASRRRKRRLEAREMEAAPWLRVRPG